MNIGTLTTTLGVDTAGLATAEVALSRFAQRIRTFGYLSSVVLTVPIIAAGKAAFSAAKNFEYSMQKIAGLTGTAQAEVNAWEKEIIQMSKVIGKGPQELAESLYFIASSGIHGAEALDVLRLSATAAESGLGDTKDVANLLTSVLNAYAGTGLTAAYATDVLVAAVREGKAEASGFASAVGQVIPVAAQLGLSFDQVAGAMAAMTLAGASASNSAVYLKGVLNTLLKPPKGGEKLLGDVFKTSFGELRKIMRDQGFIPLLQKINDLTEQYGETLTGKLFPNIRAVTGILSVAGKNFKYNSELMERVTNSTGALSVAFAAVSNTIKVQFDRALASAQGSMITLGKSLATVLLPMFNSLVEKLNNLTKWFDSLTEAQKRHKIVILMVIAALGPLSLLFSTLIYSITGVLSILGGVLTGLTTIGNAFLAITAGASASAEAMVVFRAALISTGLGALIVGLGAGIVFMIGKVNELKDKIAEMKEVAYGTTPAMDLDVSIGKQMDILKTLNIQQLNNLKINIGQRLALENERLENTKKIGKQDLDTQNFILKQKQIIADKELLIEEYFTKSSNKGVGYTYAQWKAKHQPEIDAANAAINEKIANKKAEVDYDKVSANRVIEFYNKQSKAVQAALNAQTGPIEKKAADMKVYLEFIQSSTEAAKRLEEEWNKIERASSKSRVGDSFLRSAAALGKASLMIENFSWEGKMGAAPALPGGGFMPSLTGGNVEQGKIMEELAAKVDYINLKEKALQTTLGMNRDLFDSIRAKISASSTAMESYLDIPLAERGVAWAEGLNGVIINMQNLQLEFDKLEQKKEIVQTISNALTNMAFAIGGALVGGQNAWQSFVDIILNTASQIIGALLAVAIAATIAKNAALPFGLIIAAISIAALMALWASSKVKTANAYASGTNYAPGGMALVGEQGPELVNLPRGSQVFPNNVFDKIGRANQSQGQVVFKIQGRELVGILQEMKTFNNSY